MNYGADRIIYAKPYYKIIGILFCIFCSAGYIYIPRIPIYTDPSLLLCVFFFPRSPFPLSFFSSTSFSAIPSSRRASSVNPAG